MADPKFPGLEALAKMQKDMENGVLPGLRRDPETRRDDTQPENTRRAQREGKREEKKAERQEQKDDRAQRTQERLEAAKQKAAEQRQQREAQRGLGLKLPPPPDPAVMGALVAAKPNLNEGASLLPPVQPLEGSKRGEPYTPTPIPQNWQERAGGGNKNQAIGITGAEVTSVTTIEPEVSANATATVNGKVLEFEFLIPRGMPGDTAELKGATGATGPTGPACYITLGSVTMGGEGAVTINNNGGGWFVFDFVLPYGNTGATGEAGATGETGPTGPSG